MKLLEYLGVNIFIDESVENTMSYIAQYENSNLFIISDETVYSLWKNYFPNQAKTIIIPSGESQKTFTTIDNIVSQLIEMGADRNSFLLGIGGGLVCDITGFVASVFMRGIKFAFVPTTLLAQIDASIGGKNAINSGEYKNMIGLFNHPKFILIDFRFLSTLPKLEMQNGLCEAVKHACICNKEYFNFIDENVDKILTLNKDIVENLILESIKIKTNIVSIDPLEKSERKKLNFGHTFGHAIELKNNISHGQAVSIGIAIANKIAVNRKLLSENDSNKIEKLLHKLGLPVKYSHLDFIPLNSIVIKDKKKQNNFISLVLLNNIGSSSIVNIPIENINNLLN